MSRPPQWGHVRPCHGRQPPAGPREPGAPSSPSPARLPAPAFHPIRQGPAQRLHRPPWPRKALPAPVAAAPGSPCDPGQPILKLRALHPDLRKSGLRRIAKPTAWLTSSPAAAANPATWSLSLGEMESAHRHVAQQRLKRPGAGWRVEHAEYMLALRINRINVDWDAYWKALAQPNPDVANDNSPKKSLRRTA